jgi:hypothetical protein
MSTFGDFSQALARKGKWAQTKHIFAVFWVFFGLKTGENHILFGHPLRVCSST